MPRKRKTARDIYPKYWPRKGRYAPFGYDPFPEDKQLYIANWELLDLFLEALQYKKDGCSYRQCADWLRAASGKELTHVGFLKRIQTDKALRKAKAASADSSESEDEDPSADT